MRRTITMVSLVGLTAIMTGCATSPKLIERNSVSTRNDVFEDSPKGRSVPGYADLLVSSTVKTHSLGLFSNNDVHGSADYVLLLNIDGQATRISGEPRKEKLTTHSLRDAEAGEGVRYYFNKRIRLKAGKHNVVIAIPADSVVVEREVVLAEGENSILLNPIYRAKPGKQLPGNSSATSYKGGLDGLTPVFNGKNL